MMASNRSGPGRSRPRRSPRGRLSYLPLFLLLLIPARLLLADPGSLPPDLRPGEVARGEIVGPAVVTYLLPSPSPSPPGSAAVVRIDTEDLPLRVTWAPDGGGEERKEIVLEPFVDRAWLVPDEPGRLTVGLGEDVEGGRTGYRIEVTGVVEPGEAEAARTSVEALRVGMTEDGESQLRAMELWSRAADLWRRAGRPEDAAFCLLAQALLLHERGDTETAMPLFEAAHQDLLHGAPAAAADALDGLGLTRIARRQVDEARATFERSLEIRRRLDRPSGLATSQVNLCYALQMGREVRAAAACYEEAAERLREVGRTRMEAVVINNLGGVRERLGEPLEAREHYRQALAVLPDSWPLMRARVLTNLGVLDRRLGDLGEAVIHYNQALPVFRELLDRRSEARILHNLAAVYAELGEPDVARRHYEDALAIRRERDDPKGVASTLNNLGAVLLTLERTEGAADAHREALELYLEIEDARGAALATSRLGSAVLASEPERGLNLLREGVERSEESGDATFVAGNEGRLASGLVKAGRGADAARVFRGLLGRIEGIPLPDLRLDAHRNLADLEREAGRLSEALAHAEEAEEALETLRASVPHTELRATLLAQQRSVFETHLETLMDLHRREPDGGHDRQALALSEQARARALLDLLAESDADLSSSGDGEGLHELRARETELHRRIHGKLERRLVLSAAEDDEARAEAASLEADLESLYLNLSRVELTLRHSHPDYALLSRPRPLAAQEVQDLLTPGTVLVEYALGERRSTLWAVTSEAVRSFELPGREVIEAAAREAHELLASRHAGLGPGAADALATLSRLVLEPAAEALAAPPGPPETGPVPRLVVVPDGALHFVPFAALPHPVTGQPLVESHEIAHLPSATVLAAQRRDARPAVTGSGLAVLADPVFTLDDERLHAPPPAIPPGGARLASRVEPPDPLRSGGAEIERLPASRGEAEAIAELLPAADIWKAVGFAARREDVLAGKLGSYRFVHFATHGVIDADQPRASGLLLSRYDPAGNPRDGFVSLADVYGLDLRAELVVLSGCETALGREIRGEGLMGLTHGFLHAGADRVMASLWRVQDRATAELMRHFYRSLLVEGLAPAAALREAQRSIRRNRRWRDPYYWAPFILQGDWRDWRTAARTDS